MKTMRRGAGLIAALLILFAGIVNLHGAMLPFGVAFTVVGLAAAIWQIRVLRASRIDPYDLKRLYEPAPDDTVDEPEVDYLEEDGVPYCHHCGHAVPQPYSRCPECGNTVR